MRITGEKCEEELCKEGREGGRKARMKETKEVEREEEREEEKKWHKDGKIGGMDERMNELRWQILIQTNCNSDWVFHKNHLSTKRVKKRNVIYWWWLVGHMHSS